MDKAQITLYVNENIKSKEELSPRLETELNNFIEALSLQKTTLNRVPTPQQIDAAWKHWKTERFFYVQQVQQAIQTTEIEIQKHTLAHIKQDDSEAKQFAAAYAHELKNLARLPLPEHIDLAWNSWKSGYRW